MSRTAVLGALLVGVAAAYAYSLTAGGKKVVAQLTDYAANLLTNRGIRNNNPGNIRRVAGQFWNNSFASQESCEAAGRTWDEQFVVFYTMPDGIRALGHTLQTYANNYGLNTVRLVITRWAPPSENDTDSYVQAVADELNVAPDTQIDVIESLPQLASAIMARETGYVDTIDNVTQAVYA